MAFKSALLLLALVAFTYAEAFTSEALDCCLSTSSKMIPARRVKSYVRQTVNSGCQMPAIQFITKKNMKLCAPVPEDNNWAAKLMDLLDRKQQRK
ncbi:C-C motif chemokine 19-like [Brienomyrus brachyistius]|uniref:C-C motif chemokine 19-like n=1 Tax=Brienomyrus brachyistius TaxID=42636 RepID=UPI0020B3D0CC|nr:C-C motif chemokine 19-like [Brienomyrus brachyistius]